MAFRYFASNLSRACQKKMFCYLPLQKTFSSMPKDASENFQDGRATAVVERAMTSEEVKYRIRSAAASYLQGHRILLGVISNIPSIKVEWPSNPITAEKEADGIVGAIAGAYEQVHQSNSFLLSEVTRVTFGLVGNQEAPFIPVTTPAPAVAFPLTASSQSQQPTSGQIAPGTNRGVKRKRTNSEESSRAAKRRKIMEESSSWDYNKMPEEYNREVKRSKIMEESSTRDGDKMPEESNRLMVRVRKRPWRKRP